VAFSADPQQKFVYVAGNPEIYIPNRKILEILGSFNVGQGERHPINHQSATNGRSNIYTPETGNEGEIHWWVLKGLSPSVSVY
jgi:hypothetical protein